MNSIASTFRQAQIDIAVQDATCAQETNYLGIHYAILAELQRRLIDHNSSDFVALQRHREEALSTSAATLAGK